MSVENRWKDYEEFFIANADINNPKDQLVRDMAKAAFVSGANAVLTDFLIVTKDLGEERCPRELYELVMKTGKSISELTGREKNGK